jgi:hypothetical protein
MRKFFAILTALLTGGIVIGTQLSPQLAEAGIKFN